MLGVNMDNENNTLSGRGGKREGAGRPFGSIKENKKKCFLSDY